MITGIDIAGTVGTAYARAFEMAPLEGWRKLLRGWVWLLTLLAMTSVTLDPALLGGEPAVVVRHPPRPAGASR